MIRNEFSYKKLTIIQKIQILISMFIGGILGIIVSFLVNSTLIEISICPFFSFVTLFLFT